MSEKIYRIMYKYANPMEYGSDDPLYVKASTKKEAREMGNYYKRAWDINATIESIDDVKVMKANIVEACQNNLELIASLQIMIAQSLNQPEFTDDLQAVTACRHRMDLATDLYYDCMKMLKDTEDIIDHEQKFRDKSN